MTRPTLGDRRFYVYALLDPRTKVPFYIGKGTGRRAQAHLSKARGHRAVNVRVGAKIAALREEGVEPLVVRLTDGLTESEALRREREVIQHHRADGLCNVAPGQVSLAERTRAAARNMIRCMPRHRSLERYVRAHPDDVWAVAILKLYWLLLRGAAKVYANPPETLEYRTTLKTLKS